MKTLTKPVVFLLWAPALLNAADLLPAWNETSSKKAREHKGRLENTLPEMT
jgi:thioredoxin-like negative regulator of GroEL